MANGPWPRRDGSLVFREAVSGRHRAALFLRNDLKINRFMVRTHVEPQVIRKEWLAVPTSDTDFSCIVEAGGRVVAMGFLDVVDGVGQAGMRRERHSIEALWHEELGWIDEYQYAIRKGHMSTCDDMAPSKLLGFQGVIATPVF